MPALINHTHHSSLYQRSPESLEKALDKHAAYSDLITLTEVDSDRRAKMLAEKGWEHYNGEDKPGMDNCAAMWRKGFLRLLHSEVVLLSSQKVWTVNDRLRPPLYGIIMVFEHVATKRRFVLGVVHFPSSIEGNLGTTEKPGSTFRIWSNVTRRVISNVQGTWAMKRHMLRVSRKFRAPARMIVADWNLNLARDAVRAWLKSIFPAYDIAWTPPYPREGSMGRKGGRIIDGTLYTRRHWKITHSPRLLPRDESSDHTPYTESFRLLA